MIIKPIKPHWRIIDPIECKGCIYRPDPKHKGCKSCGNWNDRPERPRK
jgi:hypothetical protein